MKHYYLELKQGEKVVKRQPTSLASEYKDRIRMEHHYQKEGQQIAFVVSSTKEKVIN